MVVSHSGWGIGACFLFGVGGQVVWREHVDNHFPEYLPYFLSKTDDNPTSSNMGEVLFRISNLEGTFTIWR